MGRHGKGKRKTKKVKKHIPKPTTTIQKITSFNLGRFIKKIMRR